MYQVYLSLGTNLGNRKRNIREVIEKIGEQIGVVERQVCFFTKPSLWGYSLPNDYINACVLVLTHDALRARSGSYSEASSGEMGRTMKSVDGEYVRTASSTLISCS